MKEIQMNQMQFTSSHWWNVIKDKYVRFPNHSVPLRALYLGLAETLTVWPIRLSRVPVLITATFNDLPHGIQGAEMAGRNFGEFVRKDMMEFLLGSHSYRKPWLKPVIFRFPDFGGESGEFHFHCIAIVHEDVVPRLCGNEGRHRLNLLFRAKSPRNRGLDIRIKSTDRMGTLVAYVLKKLPFIPDYTANPAFEWYDVLGGSPSTWPAEWEELKASRQAQP